jgi:hypothetical protein
MTTAETSSKLVAQINEALAALNHALNELHPLDAERVARIHQIAAWAEAAQSEEKGLSPPFGRANLPGVDRR